MSVESFDPASSAIVEVSAAASAHFKRQLAESKEANAVRLSVKESGCTGFMYVLDVVPEAQPDDLHYFLDEGVELLIDSASVAVVRGTKIDYVSEGVNRQLSFLNPNAKDYCGCGESFNLHQAE
ncbi:MAG TPA: iron-sulfur cluster assembly accessory protein [Cellvibrionaceae bacterium]